MKITNKKVNAAIDILEKSRPNGYQGFELRTDNIKPNQPCKKYILYALVQDEIHCPGTYGDKVTSFNTQSDFVNWAMKASKTRTINF